MKQSDHTKNVLSKISVDGKIAVEDVESLLVNRDAAIESLTKSNTEAKKKQQIQYEAALLLGSQVNKILDKVYELEESIKRNPLLWPLIWLGFSKRLLDLRVFVADLMDEYRRELSRHD